MIALAARTDHDDGRVPVRSAEGSAGTFSTESRLGVHLRVPPALLSPASETMTRSQYLAYEAHEEATRSAR